MKTQITNLIKTDIHLCRLTNQLKQLGFSTNVLTTDNLLFILYFLKIEATEEITDFYYKHIEGVILNDTITDEEYAIDIFKNLVGSKWESYSLVADDQLNAH